MGRRAVLLRMFTHTAGQNNTKQVQFLVIYLFIYLFILLLFTFKRSLSGTLYFDFQTYFDKAIVGAT